MQLKKINSITILFIITTAILASILIYQKTGGKGDKQKYDSSTVMTKISLVRELSLVKYNYSGVIGYEDDLKLLNVKIPFSEKHFLLKYHGYVKAGVDFNQIKVNISEQNIQVSMPKSRIMEINIEENSLNPYNESDNIFNQIKLDDYKKALVGEKVRIKNDAITQGILEDANHQAKTVIKSLLEEMNFKNITITDYVVIPQPK